MGKKGSICHFPRSLPASIWGHCSQVLVFTSIWGAQEGAWQWHFSCCFSQHLGTWDTQTLQKTRVNVKWQIDPVLPPPPHRVGVQGFFNVRGLHLYLLMNDAPNINSFGVAIGKRAKGPRGSEGGGQERQGVPARWFDPARGIPTPKPPTVRESHEPGPPLEGPLASCPFPERRRREGGVPAGKWVLARRGPSSWCSSACTGSRSMGIPRAGSPRNEPRPLALSQGI